MSIYAANNIAKGIRRLSRPNESGLSGVICNSDGYDELEKRVLPEFARILGSTLIDFVPRSPVVQACEVESRTVLELSPLSKEAEVFRKLASKIMENAPPVIPTPIEELKDLETMYRAHRTS